MKFALSLSAVTCLGVLLTSCFSTSIDVEAYPTADADFSAYKTYAWAPLEKEAAKEFTAKDKGLRQSFMAEADLLMAKRGFKPATEGDPDLFVYARGLRVGGYRTVGQTPAYAAKYAPGEEGSQWLSENAGDPGYLKPETQIGVRFMISDTETNKVVWRAKGMVRVDDTRSELLQREDARSLARECLKGFPPN